MKNVIQKELLSALQSLPFIILFAVSLLLFITGALTYTARFLETSAEYNKQMASLARSPSTQITTLLRKPNPLEFIADGGDRNRPRLYLIEPKGRPRPGAVKISDFKMPDVPEPDWVFIITTLFSLYVILLGYRSIAGEREQGTLRLILSNPMGRIRLLTAKFLAILLSTSIPFVLGCIACLVIMSMRIPGVLTFHQLLRIFLMILLGVVYLSIFISLSLILSSLINRPSVVLLFLLSFWILFVFIIPNASNVLASQFTRIPSEFQTAKQVGPMIQQQIWGKIDEIRAKAADGRIRTEEELRANADAAFEEGQVLLKKHYDAYDNAMRQRSVMSNRFSRISPGALFRFSAENLANTGIQREERFIRESKAYSEVYDTYVFQKMGKLVETSSWGFSTWVDLKGVAVPIQSPRAGEYQGDTSDFPFFQEKDPSLALNMQNALLDLAGLVLWNLVLIVLAFWVFIKADVR